MRSIIIFLFVILIWNGCSQDDTPVPADGTNKPPDTLQKGAVRYLALGDSYTIGQSVDSTERWPVQLADRLASQGYSISELKIIAKTGWTTGDLLSALGPDDRAMSYDMVSLLIGVNNQYRGYDTADYRVEFVELLEKSIGFAGGDPDRVVVVSIPDYGVTPFGQVMDPERIAREIDAFNAINRDEASRAGVRYVDITPVSRTALDDPSLTAEDKLHPSGKMYAAWVELIFPVALEMLR